MKFLELILDNLLANALVIVNLGAELFLVYMLLRILSDQDKTYKEIRNGTKDLIDAGKKLHSMFSIAERLAERKLNESTPYAKPVENNINRQLEQQITEGLEKLERLMNETFALTHNMMTAPSAAPRGQDASMQSLQKLINDQQLLKPELTKIQESLYRLSKNLSLAPSSAMSVAENTEEQQQTIKSYQEMLIKTRERAKDAEQKLGLLRAEIDQQSKRNEKIIADNADEIDFLKQEVKKISDERTSLIRNMDALTNEILRTKIEKDFIEDRFIELS